MKKPHSGSSIWTRRRLLKSTVAGTAALAAPAIIRGSLREARAAENVIRVMGVGTVALPDWSAFERDTGLKIEWTPIDDQIGVFLHEVQANDAGERYDLFAAFPVWEPLAAGDYLLPIDGSRLPNWAGVSDSVRNSPLITSGGNGSIWTIPLVMNADSFAYFPDALGLPKPPEPISWNVLFDNEKTKGLVGLDDSFFTLQHCAAYLKWNKLADIGNPGNLTASECESVANFLIERKKAGQFRTFWASFDEQVSLLLNQEVLAETAWEPAALEAQKQGVPAEYAWCIEGYDKWMNSVFIPKQVGSRGNIEQVYTALNWLLGGQFAAEIAVLRGYVTPRADLGFEFAKANGWSDDKANEIESTLIKLDKKFSHEQYWNNGWPSDVAAYEREMARFKNA